MFFRFDSRRIPVSTYSRSQREFRQPEVQNLRLPSICYKDVRGLHVPVDDSFRVRGVERIGDLDGQIEHCFDLQWLAIDLVPQRLPLQQFHRNEGPSIRFINFVDSADVRVVQGGCGFGFSLEAAEGWDGVGTCQNGSLWLKPRQTIVLVHLLGRLFGMPPLTSEPPLVGATCCYGVPAIAVNSIPLFRGGCAWP